MPDGIGDRAEITGVGGDRTEAVPVRDDHDVHVDDVTRGRLAGQRTHDQDLGERRCRYDQAVVSISGLAECDTGLGVVGG